MQEIRIPSKTVHELPISFLDSSNREAWDEFCLQSSEAWFWHTSKWLDYTLDYRPELRPSPSSFYVTAGGKIAAICPLILETSHDVDGEVRQFSYGGDSVPAPAFADGLSAKIRKAVAKVLFRRVDELAIANRVHRASFRLSPLSPFFWRLTHLPNPLLREGFIDISLMTHIVDLSKPEDQLLREMRNDHLRDIRRAEKNIHATVFDRSNITSHVFDRYRLLHRKAAGRTTRPLSTFEMMHGWIKDGLAVLSCAMIDDKDIGFVLASVYKDGAYYSSGCNDPEFNNLPIGHILQWRTMQWLKAHGIRYYEIGLQFYASQPHAIVSNKDWNISYFKRGFGGMTVPCWRAERFYDDVFCRRVLQERAAAYAHTLRTSEQSMRD